MMNAEAFARHSFDYVPSRVNKFMLQIVSLRRFYWRALLVNPLSLHHGLDWDIVCGYGRSLPV